MASSLGSRTGLAGIPLAPHNPLLLKLVPLRSPLARVAVFTVIALLGVAIGYVSVSASIVDFGLIFAIIVLVLSIRRTYLSWAVLLVIAPFHAWLAAAVFHHDQLLSAWKDIWAIAVMGLLVARAITSERQDKPQPVPGLVMIGLYVALAVVELLNPSSLQAGLLDFKLIVMYPIFYLFAVNFMHVTYRHVRALAWLIAVLGVITALMGIAQYFFGPGILGGVISSTIGLSTVDFTNKIYRVFATFGDSATFAIFLCVTILISASLLWFARSWWWRLALLGAMMLMAMAMFMTFNRSALFFLPVGLGVMAWMYNPRTAIIIVAGFVLGATVFLTTIGSSTISDRATAPFTGQDQSLQERLQGFLDNTIGYVESYPEGAGLGRIGTASSKFGSASALDNAGIIIQGGQNLYLGESQYTKILGEMGLIGLLFFLGMQIALFRGGFIRWKTLRDPFLRHLGRAILGLMVVYALLGLAAEPWDAFPVDLFYWSLVAVLMMLPHLDREPAVSEAAPTLTPREALRRLTSPRHFHGGVR